MKIRNILENISPQQRGVKQLPADFRPAQTSPQLSGPYPGRNATRGYLVGEDQDILEVTGDRPFDSMMSKIKKGTKKQARADRRERDAASRERARAAFGPSPADKLSIRSDKGVAEAIDIGQEWMTDTELDQYVPDQLQQQWRELVGYDEEGNVSALWANITGGYEPDANDPADRANMVKVANKWFAMKRIPNVRFYDVRDVGDELEWLVQIGEQGVAEGGYNPLDDERREQSRMDAERRQFRRDELEAELGGEEQRAQQIMSGTWYIVIDGQVWRRGGQPVTFRGRDSARRAGQTIKNRSPGKIVTVTNRVPAAEDSGLSEAPLDIDLIQRAQGGMSGTNQDPDSERFRDQPYGYRDRAPDRFDPMARLDKGAVNSIERALGIKWPRHRARQGTVKVDESRDQHYLQLFREAVARGMTSEDVLSTMKRQLGDYLQDVARAIKKDPDLIDKIPQAHDDIGPAVKTISTDDGHEIRIHGNEDDGFRISIRDQAMASRFESLAEAEMATEMYCARRRQRASQNSDYIEEKHMAETRDRSPGKITRSEDPCWSGYHMVGTKKKAGRTVPNCVPGRKGD